MTFGSLIWMGARFYDPAQARFIQVDPVTSSSGSLQSPYNYADGDPANNIDADGRWSFGTPYGFQKTVNSLMQGFRMKVQPKINSYAKASLSIAKMVSGYTDARACVGGSWGSCGWAAAGLTPQGKAARLAKAAAATRILNNFRGSRAVTKALSKDAKGHLKSVDFSRSENGAYWHGRAKGGVGARNEFFKAYTARHAADVKWKAGQASAVLADGTKMRIYGSKKNGYTLKIVKGGKTVTKIRY